MSEGFRVVDLWVGRFKSEHSFDAYLQETYSHDGVAPLSQFAADQNQTFYDHDFVEAGLHDTTDDVSRLLDGHSFANSYIDAASEAFRASGSGSANAVILVFGREIHKPQSVERSTYSLTYLGRFDCTPETPAEALGDTGPPAQVQLVVGGGKVVQFQGESVNSIPIDSRGLVIGRTGAVDGPPRVDVSDFIAGVAEVQVRIYQDQFEQWIIEDVGANGLTRIDNNELIGRTFPWHGKRLMIGTLEFQWSTRPPNTAS
jgi:hypothetical protein